MIKAIMMLGLFVLAQAAEANHEPWVTIEYPQDKDKLWWDEAWWERGVLDNPANYDVLEEKVSFESEGETIPAYIFRPKKKGVYPAVLFQHGRRGLDDITRLLPKRLAARGFVVLAPDVFTGRFIEKFPLNHDYILDKDVANSIDFLLTLKGISGDKACIVSHTRGGYMSLKALVTHKKQEDKVACYISYYPHWQDPNKPEPMQVYQYAPEINELSVPVLIFVGEHDQYQRVRPIMEGVKSLSELGRKPQLIVYPGVGRGFDFRPPHVRTFADDLAAKDAIRRTASFIRKNLR